MLNETATSKWTWAKVTTRILTLRHNTCWSRPCMLKFQNNVDFVHDVSNQFLDQGDGEFLTYIMVNFILLRTESLEHTNESRTDFLYFTWKLILNFFIVLLKYMISLLFRSLRHWRLMWWIMLFSTSIIMRIELSILLVWKSSHHRWLLIWIHNIHRIIVWTYHMLPIVYLVHTMGEITASIIILWGSIHSFRRSLLILWALSSLNKELIRSVI